MLAGTQLRRSIHQNKQHLFGSQIRFRNDRFRILPRYCFRIHTQGTFRYSYGIVFFVNEVFMGAWQALVGAGRDRA